MTGSSTTAPSFSGSLNNAQVPAAIVEHLHNPTVEIIDSSIDPRRLKLFVLATLARLPGVEFFDDTARV